MERNVDAQARGEGAGELGRTRALLSRGDGVDAGNRGARAEPHERLAGRAVAAALDGRCVRVQHAARTLGIETSLLAGDRREHEHCEAPSRFEERLCSEPTQLLSSSLPSSATSLIRICDEARGALSRDTHKGYNSPAHGPHWPAALHLPAGSKTSGLGGISHRGKRLVASLLASEYTPNIDAEYMPVNHDISCSEVAVSVDALEARRTRLFLEPSTCIEGFTSSKCMHPRRTT